MGDKILFVDDEPAFLTGYELMLRPEFEMDTAVGGEQGLAAIRDHGPYAVVVSDMRMPGMNGVQFLARVRQAVPDTTRVILTGYADIKTAMDAVNQGNVFRFLAKPCEKETLVKAILSGLVQYRLITSEQELLENTLMGSIKVLTDVLGAVSPAAIGKSIRLTRYVRHMIAKFHVPSSWCFEAAAMLSQVGCVMLDQELIQAAYVDTHLSVGDRVRFEAHPGLAKALLANVRRLEPVAWMISQQLTEGTPQQAPQVPELPAADLVFGAKMLRVAVAFDNLRMRGLANEDALVRLRYRSEFDQELVEALADMKSEESKMELRKIPISTLMVGMILQQNIKNRAGLLVVAKGQEVTLPLRFRLEQFSNAQLIESEILALVPVYDSNPE
ncbi:MAG: response regulator [Candidatus Sulfotelmatobacter sp.]